MLLQTVKQSAECKILLSRENHESGLLIQVGLKQGAECKIRVSRTRRAVSTWLDSMVRVVSSWLKKKGAESKIIMSRDLGEMLQVGLKQGAECKNFLSRGLHEFLA